MVDFCRLVFNCSNAMMKMRHLKDWLRLYYDTFQEACHTYGVKCPWKWETLVRMYNYQCPSELFCQFMICSSYLEKVTDPKIRSSLLARMVSSFEMIKRDLGW